ncbi:MAG TPA: hypothetical protein VEX86_15000 [Longimicrobium sp.]|nr:hypothetical protein [Longimicrobium sp.]
MQRHLVLTAAALALAAAAPAPAAAQLRMPPVRLIAGLGPSQGATLGFLRTAEGGAVPARHLGTNAVMLGLETRSPIRGVDLRLSLQASSPHLALAAGSGTNDEVVRPTSMSALSLDAVIRLPHVLGAQPYLLAGAGLKRYDFDQEYFRLSGQPVVPRDQIAPMLKAGAGVAWNVGRVDLFMEGSASTNRFDHQYHPVGQMVQNYTYTAGIRIPLRR